MTGSGDSEKVETPATVGSQGRSEANEWTASDSRGPLEAAGAADAAAIANEPPPTPSDPIPTTARPTDEAERSSASSGPPVGERRHVPVLPVIAGLVVGAIIGAGSAALVYRSNGEPASQGDLTALASRVDALDKRPDLQPQLDSLKAQIAQAKAPAFDPAPLQQKIEQLQSDIAALKSAGAGSLGGKVAALDAAVQGLKGQGDDMKSLNDKVAGLAGAIDGLKKSDETRQAGLAALQADQKSLAERAGAPAQGVVADSLVDAISRGQPYARQVDALAGLGADPARIAVLRENADKGVPSAQVLAAKFAPRAEPIMATAARAPADAGLVDRLKSGMLGMVSVRRADSTEGDDVGSRVSRIEADLAHDDVAGAYAAWEGLPAAAKAKSEAWGALAKTEVEAMSAARALQQQAIAALGTKKS